MVIVKILVIVGVQSLIGYRIIQLSVIKFGFCVNLTFFAVLLLKRKVQSGIFFVVGNYNNAVVDKASEVKALYIL